MKNYLLLLALLIFSGYGFSANRYWVAGSASNWNNTANWSTTSGGAGGASVPGAADVAIFNANGPGNCTVDIAVTLGGLTVNGFTAIINLNGNAFSITSGDVTMVSGTVNDTPGTSTFAVSSTGVATFSGTTFGAAVNCSADRVLLNGSTFNSSCSMTKTGAINDAGAGGNSFNAGATITNSGSGYLLMGNSNPDLVANNLTLNNNGTNRIYFAYNSAGNVVTGNLICNNTANGLGIYMADLTGSSLTILGDLDVNISGTANTDILIADQGSIIINGNMDISNTSSGDQVNCYVANGGNSSAQIGGVTLATNSGTGATTQRIRLGESGDITFNGEVYLYNNSSATNSEIFLNRNATSNNIYNENITVESTVAGCDGVLFGNNGGTSTMAAGKNVLIGVGGYVSGFLYLRNFTQTGATAQTINLSGTADLTLYDSNWGGNVNFTSPQLSTRGTTYNGTANLVKTGASNDNCAGGNNFVGNTTLVNSGDGEFNMGNGSPDTFGGNLDITNSGTSNFRLGYVSTGNTVAGNLTVVNTGAGNAVVICSDVTSTLTVNGNVTLTDMSSDADHDFYLGNSGDVTIVGNLNVNNLAPGDRCDIFVANGTDSQVIVGGTTTVVNNGTGAIVSRVWLGNSGDVTFNGDLIINNSSASANTGVYLNYNPNSSNLYNEDIVLVADNAASQGIRFGENGGTGTLAATKTVTIGVGGFIAGDLRFRNFTQVGNTPQNLSCSGTARIYNHDSNWGGNVDFDAPRMYTRGTTYNGTADLEKNGGVGDDASAGGNTFVGNAIIRNTGSNYFMMGNGFPDVWQANLEVISTGTHNIYIAQASAGNTVAGNLNITLGGSATLINISNATGSSLTVTGSTVANITSNATTSQIFLGDDGAVDFDGSVTINNNSTGTNSYVYVAYGSNSAVSVDGAFTFNQNTGVTGNSHSYIGNNGDITFNGIVTINNASAASNSDIFLNHSPNSSNLYNHNIVVTETVATGQGVRFGQGGGSGTLAASRTVTIGGGGFIAGDLRFYNFTQIGPTNQTLLATGTARIYIENSNWGGNVDFAAPRMITNGTIYNLTADLEKTGALDDASSGGNTFVGDATLTNSGSDYFMMGNGSPDQFQSDLDVICNGSDEIYLAHNSAGNTVSGDLNIAISNTGTRVELCNNAASTLTVTGNTLATITSNATTHVLVLGDNGDVDFDGNLTITNNGGGDNSYIRVANTSTSNVSVDGTFTFDHLTTATNNTQAYIGNSGSITFNGLVSMTNNSGATYSDIFCNYNPTSNNLYNNHIIVACTNPNSDGITFGGNGGSGTLAATRTVTIGVGGFISGDLEFRNFTQVGPTVQALTCTGTARIYNYDSNWGGNVTFIAPRMLTRGTTYNGTSYLQKTGGNNDHSVGGNTFSGNSQLVHTGDNQFLMGNGTADIWQSNLTVSNTGTGEMYVGYSGAGHSVTGTVNWTQGGSATRSDIATTSTATMVVGGNSTFVTTSNAANQIYLGTSGTITFNGTVNATNTSSGAGTGQIRFAENTGSLVTFNNTLNILNNGSAAITQIILGNNGTIDINNNLTVNNQGTGASSYFYMANGTSSSATVDGTTSYTQSGNVTNTRAFIANQGDITFNGALNIANVATSNNSEVFLNYNTNSLNTYNGNITVTSENAGCDGVRFGESQGVGVLSSGYTITAGGGGFVDGDLYFRNWTQLGNTAQNVTLTGIARIRQYDAVWNADATFIAPRYYTRTTTYQGNTIITKNGTTNDDSPGGNIFNQTVQITNSGNARLRLSDTNGFPDDYNGNATFIKSGTGSLEPSYNNTDTYAGDILINSNAQLYFGAAGNGRVLMDGASGNQNIVNLASSPTPLFRDLQVNKASGDVNLLMPIEITVELDLDQGRVNTTTTNLLTMRDNSSVSSVSNASHVDGPIEKIGNDAFIFPVGDSSVYRPISISAPASTAASFRAEYFKVDPHPTYNHLSLDVSLNHISSCEYWLLDRINTTNNVSVTLSWDTPTSCGVDNLPELRVARWNGSMWMNEGNGGTTGSPVSGTVISGAAVTSFSPFTLASTTANNPLPIELISFNAALNNEEVDITWETASETNNDYFVVEKSADGENWEFLVKINGAGNSSIALQYSTTDSKPFAGDNYYRLKQVDFNGEFEYVGIDHVAVPFNNVNDLSVYPNPSTGVFYIVSELDELNGIVVLNALGQEVEAKVVIEDNKGVLDLEDYEDGVYFIRTNYSVVRIIKQ